MDTQTVTQVHPQVNTVAPPPPNLAAWVNAVATHFPHIPREKLEKAAHIVAEQRIAETERHNGTQYYNVTSDAITGDTDKHYSCSINTSCTHYDIWCNCQDWRYQYNALGKVNAPRSLVWCKHALAAAYLQGVFHHLLRDDRIDELNTDAQYLKDQALLVDYAKDQLKRNHSLMWK